MNLGEKEKIGNERMLIENLEVAVAQDLIDNATKLTVKTFVHQLPGTSYIYYSTSD